MLERQGPGKIHIVRKAVEICVENIWGDRTTFTRHYVLGLVFNGAFKRCNVT